MPVAEAIVILENVRSAHNVGAVFRTAEAIGVSKVFLVGYTPAPQDRFGRVQPEIAKTALGAEAVVPWEQVEHIGTVLERLKAENVTLVAVEQVPDALDYKACPSAERIAFIFGNEVEGVSHDALKHSDFVIELPMRGVKESLNVATTAGIVLYRYLDR